ncbi:TPA: hypothetical protein ACFPBW_000464 [Neisseria meningitidis]|nr:hypothetical protein [Neisseria meningitidis]
MKTAILIDGAFFIKRVRSLGLSQNPHDAKRIADLRPLQNSLPSRQPKPKHRFSAVFAPNTS